MAEQLNPHKVYDEICSNPKNETLIQFIRNYENTNWMDREMIRAVRDALDVTDEECDMFITLLRHNMMREAEEAYWEELDKLEHNYPEDDREVNPFYEDENYDPDLDNQDEEE